MAKHGKHLLVVHVYDRLYGALLRAVEPPVGLIVNTYEVNKREDVAYYLEKVPGAFMFLSSSNPEKHTDVPHHNPKFNVDEDVLWEGSAVFVAIAEKYLNS